MKAGNIRQSIRRFNDYSLNLCKSDMNNFQDRLSLLLSFIQSDKLFNDIHVKLTNNPNVDFDDWYANIKSTISCMAGSGELSFPYNIDDRLSIMYQLLLKVDNKEIEAWNFALNFCATRSNSINVYIQFFNENITQPLMMEISYKLEDIELEIPQDDRKEVTSQVINQFFNNTGSFINQTSLGDKNNQTANISVNNNEVDKLLIDLKKVISGLAISSDEKKENLETVDVCEELLKEDKLKPIKKLLKTLIPLGAEVATIVSTIFTLIM